MSTTRRQRILECLPSIFGGESLHGQIGVIVNLMAQSLGEFDGSSRRVMLDRWVNLATGAAPNKQESAALDHLGELLQVYRLPPRLQYLRYSIEDDGKLIVFFKSDNERKESLASLIGHPHCDDNFTQALTDLYPHFKFHLGLFDEVSEVSGAANLMQSLNIELKAPDLDLSPVTFFQPIIKSNPLFKETFTSCSTDEQSGRVIFSVIFHSARHTILSKFIENMLIQRLLAGLFSGLKFCLEEESGEDNQSGCSVLKVEADEAHTQGAADPLELFLPLLEAEPAESYRQRLKITAEIIAGGLISPPALLKLMIADMGAWPCSHMQHVGGKSSSVYQRHHDTTLALGMPLHVKEHCKVCHHTRQQPCPHLEEAVMEAWITDNPLQRKILKKSLKLGESFTVHSDSLLTDRPVIDLSVIGEIQHLAIQSRRTGEIIRINHILKTGKKLRLYPSFSEEAELLQQFDNDEGKQHHRWLDKADEQGKAEWLKNKDKKSSEIRPEEQFGSSSFPAFDYLTGSVLFGGNMGLDPDVSRFADLGNNDKKGMTFGRYAETVQTPQILSGDNQWVVIHFVPRQKDPNTKKAPSSELKINLELRWYIRPPYQFRVSIPKTPWVRKAWERGAWELVARDLKRGQAAGVVSELSFPEPVYKLTHNHSVRFASQRVHQQWSLQHWQTIPAHKTDGQVNIQLTQQHTERYQSHDGIGITGIFDYTRLGTLLLMPDECEDGFKPLLCKLGNEVHTHSTQLLNFALQTDWADVSDVSTQVNISIQQHFLEQQPEASIMFGSSALFNSSRFNKSVFC